MAQRADGRGTSVGIMLVSALLFGYFGFAVSWNHYSVINGQFLLFVALLNWTLKISAVAFLASGVLTMVAPLAGELLYATAGLLGAIMLIGVAVMDILDTQHTAMSPFLVLVFAAWNGYGSWMALREIAEMRREGASPAAPSA